METKKRLFSFLLLPSALFLVLLAGVVIGARYYYQFQKKSLITKTRDELATVAGLKAGEIIAWRKERCADIEILSKITMFSYGNASLANPDIHFNKTGILLDAFRKAYGYHSIIVMDLAGHSIQNTRDPAHGLLHIDSSAVAQVLAENKMKIVDFYQCPACRDIHLDLIAPLSGLDSGSAATGVVIVRLDPQQFLFPLIQSWPTPSRTSETLLFRQEGDRVVYLNELRHQKSTTLQLSISVREKNLPAARLLRGEKGFVEGVDYRGVPVFTYGQSIRDSPWYIVAKVDKEEVLAPLGTVMVNTIIIGGLFLCMLTSLLIMWWIAYDRKMVLAWSSAQIGRRQAENRQQESDEKASTIFDNTSVGMSITQPSGQAKMNSAFCEMLGYSPNELSNTKWQDLSHADDIEATQNIVKLLLAGKENSARFTKRYLKKNGDIVWAEVNTVLKRSADGKPSYFITSALDITVRRQAEEILKRDFALSDASRRTLLSVVEDQKQTEETLRQSEEKFSLAFKTAPYSITITRPDNGEFIEVNDAFTTMSGYTREEALADSSIGLKLWVNEEERRRVVDDLRKGMAVKGHEYLFKTKSGCNITGLFSAQTIKLSSGLCVLSSINDITGRKLMEGKLQKTNRDLDVLLSNLYSGILSTSKDGEVEHVNQAFCDLFNLPETPAGLCGLSSPEMIKKIADSYANPDATIARIQELVARGEPVKGEEILMRDGRFFLVDFIPVTDNDGIGNGRIWHHQDITELKQAEEKQKQLEDQLRQSQKLEAIGQLASGIAHDFNNLLGGIMGQAELLRMSLDPVSPLQQQAEAILSSSIKAASLTRQLLMFARKAPIEFQNLDLNSFIKQVVELLQRTIDHRIEITLILPDQPAVISGDPNQLENALLNIAINARDAMPEGGRLSIVLETVGLTANSLADLHFVVVEGPYARLSIIDTGTGMSREIKDRIFEPFFTTKEVGKGTGLGLASVYGCVKQHHGYIMVESQVGYGTQFFIYLPMAKSDGTVASF